MKNRIKKYAQILWQRHKLSSAVQIQQRQLFLYYREKVQAGLQIPLKDTGFRNFSQFEEDGLLLFIFAVIGMEHKSFVEIGSDDGVNSNCANLYFHFGFNGLFIDANARAIDRGRYFYGRYPHPWFPKPRFECSFVLRENINQLLQKNNMKGKVGVLSIDIDGNDYWIWDAITEIEPQVVVIETHVEFGYNDIVVPYDAQNKFNDVHSVYHGASPVAMKKLGKKKGYKLIGTNELGFNFIFIKEGIDKGYFPEKDLEELLTHPTLEAAFARFESVKHLPFEKPL